MEEIKQKYEQINQSKDELCELISVQYDMMVKKMEKTNDLKHRYDLFINFLELVKFDQKLEIEDIQFDKFEDFTNGKVYYFNFANFDFFIYYAIKCSHQKIFQSILKI